MASPPPSPEPLIISARNPSPLQRLEIGTQWEHELAWPHMCLSLAQENSSSAALTVPPNDADHLWPEEWELLLALYHHYSSLSEGYTLSTSLSCAWVHFSCK